MDWKWEVNAWVRPHGAAIYTWDLIYGGASLLRAIQHMRKAKRNGASCVKLEWR